jgi:HSP20 family protein
VIGILFERLLQIIKTKYMTVLKFRPENRYSNPGTSLLTFSDIMNDYFGYSHGVESNSLMERPKVNIIEDKEEFRLEFALAGYSKEHVKIELENDLLKVSGKFPIKEDQSGELKKSEFLIRDFERNFILPDSINSELIKGSMENGILTLQLPLKEEVKPKPAKNIVIE